MVVEAASTLDLKTVIIMSPVGDGIPAKAFPNIKRAAKYVTYWNFFDNDKLHRELGDSDLDYAEIAIRNALDPSYSNNRFLGYAW